MNENIFKDILEEEEQTIIKALEIAVKQKDKFTNREIDILYSFINAYYN